LGGEIALLFLDASHFVLGCDFLGHIYGKFRRFVKTFSGRQRYNVLGALDFVSKKVATVTNTTYVTAAEICALLSKIADEHMGKPIHVVLENAAYQKCQMVRNHAEKLRIHLEYIPPYSPNLNLIERFWKHVKGLLRSRCYKEFDVFREVIDSIVGDTGAAHKERVASLVDKKVQVFDDLVPVTEASFERAHLQEAA